MEDDNFNENRAGEKVMEVGKNFDEKIDGKDEHHAMIGSARLSIAILAMTAVFVQYIAKLDMSVNIVCMMNHTAETLTSNNTDDVNSQCSLDSSGKTKDGPFQYTQLQTSNLLAAFFYGYILTEIPSGFVTSQHGSYYVVAGSVVINCICASMYVLAAETNFYFLLTLRVIVGAASGTILPAVSNIWTTWAPRKELSILLSIAMSGAHLAPIFIMPISGLLCHNTDWRSTFYLVAAIEAVFIVIWLVLYSNTPDSSWITNVREREYIRNHIASVKGHHSELEAPWRALFTSRHCWAMFLTHTCINWAFYTLLCEIPMYMNEVLYFDIASNGFVSASPYVAIWILTTLSGYLSDLAMHRNIFKSRTVVRKIAVALGTLLPAIFLFSLGFVTCKNPKLAVGLLIVGQGCFGITWGAGHMCNANDLAPLHAAVVFGVSNTLATIPGILTPYVTGYITHDNSQESWKIVFTISSVSLVIGCIIFLVFGSGELQEWDSDQQVQQHRKSISMAM